MNKPKYQIGDRISKSSFIVRGVMTQSDGNHRYFLQLGDSDNTFVGTEENIEDALNVVEAKVKQHYPKHFK